MKTFRSSAVSESLAMARKNAEGTEPGSVEREQIEIVQNVLKDPVKEMDLALESLEDSKQSEGAGKADGVDEASDLAMTSRSG
jgi:hypothetical protein